MKFDIRFTDKKITPWCGMVFLKQMLQKIGFRKTVDENTDLPKAKSNRGYQASTILESFIISIWCGANRFLHTEVTRHDAVLGDIFDWKRTLGQDTYKRFFRNLIRLKTKRLAIIFIHGFLTISSLIISH